MKIRVLYFALLRDAMERAEEALEVPETVRTVGELRTWLMSRGEPSASALSNAKRLRAAVSQDMAEPDTVLKAGDEVAFFPPVTGG